MGWLDHKQLMIIKGTGKTPFDSYSAENNPVVVNLMAGNITLTQDGWSPQVPQIKNGGVWADSPISDGRQLLTAPYANVIEKITVIISDNSYLGAIKALDSLNAMVKGCVDYWQTQVQIDPVYLMWYASCGAGKQYSLIYSIQLATTFLDSPTPSIRVDMTIEREPIWRWEVPPGGNPRMWTILALNQQLSENTLPTLLPVTFNGLFSANLNNKFEWTPAAAGAQTTPITKNYIDIPGSSLPGDAPVLVEIDTRQNQTHNLYLGITSKPQSYINHLGVTKYNALNLMVGDSDVAGTMAKTISGGNDGMKSNNSSVNLYYGLRTKTGADANFVQVAQWGNSPTSANGITLDRNFFRGTYAVFVRASNNSGTPVIGDMDMQLTIEEVEGGAATNQLADTWTSAVIPVPLAQTVGGQPYAPISYMGSVTIPFATRVVNSLYGYGLQIQEGSIYNSLRVTLYHRVNVGTANRIIRAYDVMFMPIDEGMVQIIAPYGGGTGTIETVLDNTGYIAHGQPGQYCVGYNFNQITGGVGLEARGADIYLKPKTDYRLYVLADQWASANADYSFYNATFSDVNIKVSIVPCSYGIRDA